MYTVECMETSFLTLAEAAAKTGRSQSTVRRVIHTITKTPEHRDRDTIQPTPAQVRQSKQKGENFTWRIREDILLKYLHPAPREAKKTTDPSADILVILKRELETKNTQIEQQWEIIRALNERLHEGNILMGALQKRLALPPSAEPAENIVIADPAPSNASVTAVFRKSSAKVAAKESAALRARRRGLWRWVWGGPRSKRTNPTASAT